MLDIFRGLKNLVKVSHLSIDSNVFKLHYSFTVMALLAFSLIVTTRQYVGNPIDCVHTKDIPEDVVNTYCWIHSTFTIKSAFNKTVGEDVAYPGVANGPRKLDPHDTKEVAYYQWVCFCLFIQAVMFYIPRWLWKIWECGKIQALILDLDIGIYPEVERKQKKKLLLDYLHENLENHDWWTYRYFFCEFLSLVNVVGQMFLMDSFFDGEFLNFGFDVIAFAQRDQEDRVDPMRYIFPRMTKCRFYKYGATGDLERHDVLCILPLNVVNEKIYIFLWFWFVVLFFLTALQILYRMVIIASPRIRAYLLCIRFRLINRDVLHTLVAHSKVGDWYVFYMLGINLDTIIFKEVMHELAKRLGHPSKEIEA